MHDVVYVVCDHRVGQWGVVFRVGDGDEQSGDRSVFDRGVGDSSDRSGCADVGGVGGG